MSVSYHYLALESDHQMVVDWFNAQQGGKAIDDRPNQVVIYFRDIATQPLPAFGEIDQEKTPLVWITKPQKRLRTLWTDAEVLFTPTPLKPQFPALQKISASFAKWLKQFPVVYSQQEHSASDWKYYLEAGIQNVAPVLYALPQAMAILQKGQYFVHYRANSSVLDTLARNLRLRGYDI